MSRLRRFRKVPPDKFSQFSPRCGDISQTTLIALKESADAFPPLKSVAGGVLALWNIVERIRGSKARARALSLRAAEILNILADAIPDPSNIPPSMLTQISSFERLLNKIITAMEPLTKQSWRRSLPWLNRNEAMLDDFQRQLDEACRSFVVGSTARIEVTLSAVRKDVSFTKELLIKRDDSRYLFISVGLF